MDYLTEIEKIKAQINNASLMAVSKTRSIEEILSVYDCGVYIFGENTVQEIKKKFLNRPSSLELHMIGHLQSNKVRDAVLLTDMIESVDSYRLLCLINQEAEKIEKIMPVLLEINTSSELSKYGFSSENMDIIEDVILKSKLLKNIEIEGFMTVGSINREDSEKCFSKLFKIKEYFSNRYSSMNLSKLSMGMSNDYLTAVKCGSTQVRIGTLIFGERHYD